MLKTIIVDDDDATRMLLTNYINKTEFLELTGVCKDGIEAANMIRKNEVDLVFLDIEMPGMDGMELISTITNVPEIILVSSQEKYAVQAFEHAVTDYLLKPIQYGRFLKSAQRAYDNLQKTPEEEKQKVNTTQQGSNHEPVSSETEKKAGGGKSIFVKVKSQLIKIKTEEILWVEAQGDYVDIKTKEKTYTIHSTMKNIEQKLPDDNFQRAHRSYIVNTEMIKLIDEGMLVIGERLIPVGSKYQKALMKKINTLNR